MRLLPGLRAVVTPPTRSHQGGWDEILLFFAAPIALFALLRWLGIRRERKEQENPDQPGP